MKRGLMRTAIEILVVAGIVGLSSSAMAKIIYALTADNKIMAFDSSSPGVLTLPSTFVGGLEPSEELTGIDFRPATGELVGVSTFQTLYQISISHSSGVPIATATRIGYGFAGVLTGDKVGIDFNPVADRVRLTTNQGSNLRLDPDTGELAAQDTALSPAAGIAEIAYDRSYPGTPQTTLFGLNSDSNSLVRIGGVNGIPSPNGGNVFPVGSLGVDFDSFCAIDFAVTELLGIIRVQDTTTLVTIDPGTGSILSNHGSISDNPPVTGMAIAPEFLADVKMKVKRVFNKPQKDSIKLSALVNIPAGFQVEGAAIHLNIGGVLRAYVLDSKGKASLGHDRVSLKVKSKKGAVSAQQAKFSIKMGGGNYVELDDEGLTNTNIKNSQTQVFISLAYGNEIAQGILPLTYTAKQGKTGKAKN